MDKLGKIATAVVATLIIGTFLTVFISALVWVTVKIWESIL